MVLVDTSVLIEFFRGRKTQKVGLFDEILARDIPFGISPYTYQEVVQGARDEQEYESLREYLDTQTFYFLPNGRETHEKAARLYFDLRRLGITVRGTIDILIALTAMENNLALLHNDRDFDAIAAVMPDCKILNALP